jgi:hypothetical protein
MEEVQKRYGRDIYGRGIENKTSDDLGIPNLKKRPQKFKVESLIFQKNFLKIMIIFIDGLSKKYIIKVCI